MRVRVKCTTCKITPGEDRHVHGIPALNAQNSLWYPITGIRRCDCPKHLAGVDCTRNATPSRMAAFGRDSAREAADPMPCLNHCVGRGKCVLGTCICHRGKSAAAAH